MALPSSIFLRSLLVLGVLGLGLWSLATVRFQTELLPLFPQDLASVQVLKKAQASVVSEHEVIVVARPGTNPGWAVMQKLAEKLRGRPGIGSVQLGMGTTRSPSEWLASMISELPPERFSSFVGLFKQDVIDGRLRGTLDMMTGAIDESEMGRLRFDPLRMEEIIFPDHKSSPLAGSIDLPPVLTIGADRPLKTFEDDQRFVDQVKVALDAATTAMALNPPPGFLLTGQPAFTADISRQMKRDIIVMLTFTITLISLAFWCTYRSFMPLVWIIVAQLMAVLCAATAGRLVFGELNVMSIGFSSILLGVGMDYCILVYHFFAQEGPVDARKWRELRQAIWLSSLTTAATFGVLYFSSFPGLRQLAVLVGIGLVATAFFATTFLADLLACHRPRAPKWLEPASDRYARWISRHRVALRLIALGIVVGALLMYPRFRSYPFYDSSIKQLEPTQIEAFQAQKILEETTAQMPQPVIEPGDPERNRLMWKVVSLETIKDEFQNAGFDATWSSSTLQVLGALNQWQLGQLDLTGPDQANAAWIQLRTDLNRTAVNDFERLSLFMLATVIILCAVAHRSIGLVALNMAALGLALLMLGALLVVTGNSMTLVSLLCIPLMIGLVIDYSLHIVRALVHEDGDLVRAFRHLAAPVVLTGLASIIGFTAPMLSSQPALQNFGNVMDLGTLAAVVSGLILLPVLFIGLKPVHLGAASTVHSESLYSASMFSLGAWLARNLPLKLTRGVADLLGRCYALTHPSRVACVQRNLQLLNSSIGKDRAQRVYSEFAQTMADYFYVATRSPEKSVGIIAERSGYEHLEALHAQGRGALIVTAHLGLFELGGLLMAQSGFPTAVLTLPEPSRRLTAWRAQARKNWNVETIEVGTDPFAFLQIAKRLREGCFVAALIDRPGSFETTPVPFPNGTAHFSSGILLLAAQCGVPVVPTTMVRQADGFYRAEVFAPIEIEALATRDQTLRFYTEKIAGTLMPTLCKFPEQWFQFVPLA